MHWYAIHTKPRNEAVAEAALRREGIATFYPKLRTRKTIRRKRQWVTQPLFPCYFFARFSLPQSQRLVRYSRGVANIVSFGGRPAVVNDEVVRALQAAATDDVVIVPRRTLRPGDVVQIEDGPLRGLQGILEREVSASERVVILLQIISQGARVEAPIDAVSALQ